MKRFFVDSLTEPYFTLTGAENRHLSEVLRAKVNDRVILCSGDGYDCEYEITGFSKNATTLRFVSRKLNDTEPALELTVYFAVLRGDRSELVVQKLTELGVRRIVPFISEFCVARPDKTERLERAAREACKQCGRAVIPEVSGIQSFADMTALLGRHEKIVFAYEDISRTPVSLPEYLDGGEKNIGLVIGPEGGFSETEYRILSQDMGIVPVSLGKRILRAETAAIAASSVILSIEGEW